MKIAVKEGCVLKEINPWFLATCQKVMELGVQLNYTPTITSLADGKHMIGSRHYLNLAMDLRTSDLTESKKVGYLKLLKETLGDTYDVVLEKDHMHVEQR